MELALKREPEIIPEYSLTGDLLSFLRCALQYRYHNGSSLPPSRPVQLWFGEFIHGVMEGAYRVWRDGAPAFPWPLTRVPYHGQLPEDQPMHDIGSIGHTVEETLRAQGKNSRNEAARESAYRRAEVAVNEIGPHLFPLVQAAEERVIGTRNLKAHTTDGSFTPRAGRYELHGIIDVLTDVRLSEAAEGNLIGDAISRACPDLSGRFEVIVDYKGWRRPAVGHDYWVQGDWQVQTYAWLRERQPNSLPVAAGVLLYVNELASSQDDLALLKRELRKRSSDVLPARGSDDYYLLETWRRGEPVPDLSLDLRMQRAIRVIPVTAESQDDATSRFDEVVIEIERCVAAEASQGRIIGHWAPGGDAETCVACDFRHFCPTPRPRRRKGQLESPKAP